jgi:hypothetical protein
VTDNEDDVLHRLAAGVGGKIEEVAKFPDGTGAAIMTMPLPADHWLTAYGDNEPPMLLRSGTDSPTRLLLVEAARQAAKYAVRASTDNGRIIDFDPDAMVQNFVIGLVGYFTPDGKSQL